MSANSSVHWKDGFMQAVNESDAEKIYPPVLHAELAISLRREELADSTEAREELSTMAVAMEALRSIRVNQLEGGPVAGTAEFCWSSLASKCA